MSYSPSFLLLPPTYFPRRSIFHFLFSVTCTDSCHHSCPPSRLRPRHRLLRVLRSYSALRYPLRSERHLNFSSSWNSDPPAALWVKSGQSLDNEIPACSTEYQFALSRPRPILALVAIQYRKNICMKIKKVCSESAYYTAIIP